MPASQQTEHGLNLWTAEDHPLREDFVSDNQKIDDLISQHMADTTLHKTAADPTPMVYGSYTGNGESIQQIPLEFHPQMVLVFANKVPAIQKNDEDGLTLFAGIAVGTFNSGPVYIFSDNGFTVRNNPVGSSIYALLNKSGQVYAYAAFR